MTEVATIVARSLRILGVLDPDEAPEARYYETAIVALNAMMRRWEANGISLGWQPVSNPAETLPAPEEAEDAITDNLAIKLRPEYGVQIPPDVIQRALSGLNELRRDQEVATPIQPILDVPTPENLWRFNGYGPYGGLWNN